MTEKQIKVVMHGLEMALEYIHTQGAYLGDEFDKPTLKALNKAVHVMEDVRPDTKAGKGK